MKLNVVILAAGQSKRMRSALPKLLHLLAGKPILEHLLTTAQSLHPANIYIVYGHAGEQLQQRFSDYPVQWVKQNEQLGTGHALAQAISAIADDTRVLVSLGDNPLISLSTFQKLLAECPADALGIVTAIVPEPTGLGRILRDQQGKMIGIVEEKDASAAQKQITEINSGIMVAPVRYFKRWLPLLKNDNAQGEYYLPDIIPHALQEKVTVVTVQAATAEEVQGVNDRAQLAKLERYQQQKIAQQLMAAGVTLLDPNRFDVRGELHVAPDVTIDINVIIEGKVTIGAKSYIGPNTILHNVEIGENVTIKANSMLEDAVIGDGCIIGPFARIRPGTQLQPQVHVGNFVELKNAQVGEGSKINHLSYVGDTTVGKHANIGAGTITCNYDGVDKHRTTIGDNAFIGSNTALIAPITVGDNATIGAGSTLTQNAPADALTLSRAEQRSIANWRRGKNKE